MLVSSTLNPSCRSSVHLLVVHFNDERVLVPVDSYAKYTDLQEFIIKEWSIKDQKIIVETDELDICSGRKARIHEEAWVGVKDIVGNIYVRIRRDREQLKTQRQSPNVSSIKNELKHEEVLTSREPSESADEAEVEQQTRAEIHKDDFTEETPTVRRREQDPKQVEKTGEDAPSRSPRKQKPQGDTLGLFSDEVERRGSDSEGSQKEEQKGDTASVKETTTMQKPTWKSFLGSLHKTTTPSNPPNSANTMSTLVTPTPGPRFAGARAKADFAQPSGDGDSERVLIVVEPPADNIYEARGFRIRREHSVRTALRGACKAFKIDFTKARLRMVTEVDESGELVTVKCDDTDTMNYLDVHDNQRFIIEMVEEEEEEETD